MRTFLAFGPFDPGDVSLVSAAGAAGGELKLARTTADLELGHLGRRVDVVLLRLDAPELDDFMAALHTHPKLEGAPLLVVLPRLTPTAAIRAAGLGADDFLAVDELATLLPTKLAAAAQPAVAPSRLIETKVLLADASALHARVHARLLGQAGFAVTAVSDGPKALAELATANYAIAIADLGLPRCEPARLLVDAREKLGAAPPPAIGMTHAGIAAETAAAAIAGGYRHIHDKRRPPDELVFLANEASTLDHAPMRSSPRLLCALLVGFRREGGRWEYGLSHNLSLAGMFVRTIDPPPRGAVLELEFTPPGCSSPLTARGEVAWRKDFSRRAERTAPTGMGLRLVDPDDAVQRAMAQAARLLAQGATATP
ncbi:MAG TPA: PilZ domain-containing protein [Polyangia bacterium]|jgi:uncharacterized protein (TIGR02266 family)